jgi:hypothetical protein
VADALVLSVQTVHAEYTSHLAQGQLLFGNVLFGGADVSADTALGRVKACLSCRRGQLC